ncbi:type VI protein secretion system component VasK [Hymenobacter sp. UYAg731]
MSFDYFLPATLLLSAPIGDDGLGYLVGRGLFLVFVAVSVLLWRYGLRWVRRKEQRILVAVGVFMLVVALASGLAAYQLFVMLVFG